MPACPTPIYPPACIQVYHFYQISFYLTHLISVTANKCTHNHTLSLCQYPDILVKDTLVMNVLVTDILVTGHFGNHFDKQTFW